ncbi:MAG: hypothetical protein HGA61_02655 [Candidatus Moranbacteria bacterium]|nr:hypothetical protein [Candidatus Moranbacteria bacterium]
MATYDLKINGIIIPWDEWINEQIIAEEVKLMKKQLLARVREKNKPPILEAIKSRKEKNLYFCKKGCFVKEEEVLEAFATLLRLDLFFWFSDKELQTMRWIFASKEKSNSDFFSLWGVSLLDLLPDYEGIKKIGDRICAEFSRLGEVD